MSECEEVANTINRLVEAGHITKAQELLELALDDYFVMQLAMFANTKVNAHATIAAWKQAGLRLPAEDTDEFDPYRDSPPVTEEQLKAEVDKLREENKKATGFEQTAQRLSHQEFVSVLRTGRLPVTVDTGPAYQFAASWSNKFVWHITGWMQLLFTSPAMSVAIVILAVVLRDARILLAIPAAIIGPPGIYGLLSYRLQPDYDDTSPEVRRAMLRITRGSRIRTKLHQVLDKVAIIGALYTWFTFGWRSPWFLVCAAYLVTFLECVIYHALVRHAFLRMLVDDPDFYNAALDAAVIRS